MENKFSHNCYEIIPKLMWAVRLTLRAIHFVQGVGLNQRWLRTWIILKSVSSLLGYIRKGVVFSRCAGLVGLTEDKRSYLFCVFPVNCLKFAIVIVHQPSTTTWARPGLDSVDLDKLFLLVLVLLLFSSINGILISSITILAWRV